MHKGNSRFSRVGALVILIFATNAEAAKVGCPELSLKLATSLRQQKGGYWLRFEELKVGQVILHPTRGITKIEAIDLAQRELVLRAPGRRQEPHTISGVNGEQFALLGSPQVSAVLRHRVGVAFKRPENLSLYYATNELIGRVTSNDVIRARYFRIFKKMDSPRYAVSRSLLTESERETLSEMDRFTLLVRKAGASLRKRYGTDEVDFFSDFIQAIYLETNEDLVRSSVLGRFRDYPQARSYPPDSLGPNSPAEHVALVEGSPELMPPDLEVAVAYDLWNQGLKRLPKLRPEIDLSTDRLVLGQFDPTNLNDAEKADLWSYRMLEFLKRPDTEHIRALFESRDGDIHSFLHGRSEGRYRHEDLLLVPMPSAARVSPAVEAVQFLSGMFEVPWSGDAVRFVRTDSPKDPTTFALLVNTANTPPFIVKQPKAIRGRIVVLVDLLTENDVVMNALRAELMRQGAKRVLVLTVLKAN